MKNKEELLWDEVLSLRDILIILCQWGITALLGFQTAIFFIRKDTYEQLVASSQINSGELVPFDRYVIGTTALIIVAIIFSTLTVMFGNRYRFYKNLLYNNDESGIEIIPTSPFGRWVVVALFFIFPLMDIALRVYISFEFHVK